VLLLRLLLGLEPNRERRRLESIVPPSDAAAFTPIDLRGIRAFGQAWNVALTDTGLTVDCVDEAHGAV
jgi:hypothetical protein